MTWKKRRKTTERKWFSLVFFQFFFCYFFLFLLISLIRWLQQNDESKNLLWFHCDFVLVRFFLHLIAFHFTFRFFFSVDIVAIFLLLFSSLLVTCSNLQFGWSGETMKRGEMGNSVRPRITIWSWIWHYSNATLNRENWIDWDKNEQKWSEDFDSYAVVARVYVCRFTFQGIFRFHHSAFDCSECLVFFFYFYLNRNQCAQCFLSDSLVKRWFAIVLSFYSHSFCALKRWKRMKVSIDVCVRVFLFRCLDSSHWMRTSLLGCECGRCDTRLLTKFFG